MSPISVTPLPPWRDLIPPPRDPGIDDRTLAAPWRRRGEGAVWFSRAAWALSALVRWRRDAAGIEAPSLWLPDYFCDQSTRAARQAGAKVVHYPVDAELRPSWDVCEDLAHRTGRPDLFVLVHYFGVPTGGVVAAAFCRATGAVLVEDAAHVPAPGGAIGTHGAFVFYSPHKILAVPDGAVLVVRNPAHEAAVRRAADLDGTAAPATGRWWAKRLALKLAPGLAAWSHRRLGPFDPDEPSAEQPLEPTPRPSSLARALLAGADPAAAAAARAERAAALRREWTGIPGCRPLVAAPADGEMLYRFVVRCDDPEVARDTFEYLRRCGCPVEVWPDLAPEVRARPSLHAAALRLRRTLLLLPVHPSASARQLTAHCSGK